MGENEPKMAPKWLKNVYREEPYWLQLKTGVTLNLAMRKKHSSNKHHFKYIYESPLSQGRSETEFG